MTPTGRPTLADVAAPANVAISTASLAFSTHGRIASSTRERVLAVARDLHYLGPDPRARSLRRGRSGTIGVAMEGTIRDSLHDPVALSLLDGVAEEIGRTKLSLLLFPGDAVADSLSSSAMDGLIVMVGDQAWASNLIGPARRHLPVVHLGGPARPDTSTPTVTLDEYAASLTLARHLHDLGHRHVGVATLPLEAGQRRGWRDQIRPPSVWYSGQRLAAVLTVFPDAPVWTAAASLVEEGRVAGQHLLDHDSGRRPTAVIAQSDLLAAGVIMAADRLDLTVPRDVSVVGFDGIRLDSFITHDLTTMVQPAQEQGRAATQLLLDLIDGHPSDTRAFTARFHEGTTTGPPREQQPGHTDRTETAGGRTGGR